jgi:MFS transporter, PAT family, beta-lactamase induction signal transducer AmpG
MKFLLTFFQKRLLVCIVCGFSSGLPLYLLIQLIPAWMRSEQIDLTTIGIFSFFSMPYTWKFLWAPFLDIIEPPILHMRRGWTLITQIILFFLIVSIGQCSVTQDLFFIGLLCLLISFTSASQDIVLDAYRREILPDHELGLGNSYFVNAYRLSSLIPGSLALILSDTMSWNWVFFIVASSMSIGVLGTLWMDEPSQRERKKQQHISLSKSLSMIFRDFFTRFGVTHTFLILLFVLLYKLGDNMATALSTPFYLDLGFSKTTIGTTVKVASLWSSIFGGFVGGAIMLRIGINKALWIFGFIQLLSILGFAYLSRMGNDEVVLFWVVSFEYLGVGLGTAAFVSFIAQKTNPLYAASQIALLTSVMGLTRSISNATTGYLIEYLGYEMFFYLCTGLAIPGMLLLIVVAPFSSTKIEHELEYKS